MMPRSPSRLAAYFSLTAVIGCGVDVTGGTGTGGGGVGSMDSGSGVGCFHCVCETYSQQGGCKEFCEGTLQNLTTPNFCDDPPRIMPLPHCAFCMAMTCGVTDWTQCK